MMEKPANPSPDDLKVDHVFLDALLPMHLRIDVRGIVRHAGPTFLKLYEGDDLVGRSLFEVMEIRKPRGIKTVADLSEALGQKMRVNILAQQPNSLRGQMLQLPEEQGYLINLALGTRVVTMLQSSQLLAKDFAPTDASMDLLYLLEVQAAVLKASRSLNNRLHGANVVAEELATTDSLTGLNNRRALRRFVRKMLEADPSSSFAMMMIDLDYFKQVNDEYGHAAGDHVLKEVADILLAQTRSSDLVARVGGDEFVVVLTRMDSEKELKNIAERILTATAKPIHFGQVTCQIGASIGMSLVAEGQAVNLETLMNVTDAALYQSKEAGRGRMTVGAL